MASKWTKEQIKFLKENAKRMNHKELTKAFNETFNLNRTERAISVKKTQYGIYRINVLAKDINHGIQKKLDLQDKTNVDIKK